VTEGRPYPPARLTGPGRVDAFEPAPGLAAWARATFMFERSPLFNPDHAILATGQARIGWLWTNAESTRQGRRILGKAETPHYQGGGWAKDRQAFQMREWFAGWFGLEPEPEFIITLDAIWCAQAPDAAFCALVEHELYHCAQAPDPMGGPAFHRETGRPKWRIRGHDVEEFTGVVARYGPDTVGARAFIDAANSAEHRKYLASINVVCGTMAAA
jgi:hypothetical protein